MLIIIGQTEDCCYKTLVLLSIQDTKIEYVDMPENSELQILEQLILKQTENICVEDKGYFFMSAK